MHHERAPIPGELLAARAVSGLFTNVNRPHLGARVLANAVGGDALVDDGVVVTTAIIIDDGGVVINLVGLMRRHAILVRPRAAKISPRHKGVTLARRGQSQSQCPRNCHKTRSQSPVGSKPPAARAPSRSKRRCNASSPRTVPRRCPATSTSPRTDARTTVHNETWSPPTNNPRANTSRRPCKPSDRDRSRVASCDWRPRPSAASNDRSLRPRPSCRTAPASRRNNCSKR